MREPLPCTAGPRPHTPPRSPPAMTDGLPPARNGRPTGASRRRMRNPSTDLYSAERGQSTNCSKSSRTTTSKARAGRAMSRPRGTVRASTLGRASRPRRSDRPVNASGPMSGVRPLRPSSPRRDVARGERRHGQDVRNRRSGRATRRRGRAAGETPGRDFHAHGDRRIARAGSRPTRDGGPGTRTCARRRGTASGRPRARVARGWLRRRRGDTAAPTRQRRLGLRRGHHRDHARLLPARARRPRRRRRRRARRDVRRGPVGPRRGGRRRPLRPPLPPSRTAAVRQSRGSANRAGRDRQPSRTPRAGGAARRETRLGLGQCGADSRKSCARKSSCASDAAES